MEPRRFQIALAAALALYPALAAFADTPPKKGMARVTQQPFGKMPDGTPVDMFVIDNGSGMEARIITYGGALQSLTAPDRKGQLGDVVLGMDTLDGYRSQTAFLGALIGRYGNRIGNGQFTLDGKTYHLPKNDGANTLHGGPQGFDKKVWKAKIVKTAGGPAIQLDYISADGEMGFPGALHAKVTYTLTDKNELSIQYEATTDRPTVVNLTNHSYFNLAGGGDVLNYQVQILADRYAPVAAGLIPTGEFSPVKGTPFDFTSPTVIGARIGQQDAQLLLAGGYDHDWVLNHPAGELAKSAEVYEPSSGRVMEVWTTEPGLQFYTANFMDGTIHGKGGRVYNKHAAFCMETQHHPDSPNKPKFPTTELKPGATYHSQTVYKFSAR